MAATTTEISEIPEIPINVILNAAVAQNEKLLGISQAEWDKMSEADREVSLGVRCRV